MGNQARGTGAADVLAGGGEMGELMRSTDWTRTPLGAVDSWPGSLRTAVSICLNSRFPILVWWGPQLVMLYNDAYRPILGTTKHPTALGQPGREIWPEIWNIIGPMLEQVMSEGRATWSDSQMLPLDRNGYVEECYFTFSYSPIHDETGRVGGVFTAVTETTGQLLSARRLRALRELATRGAEARTAEGACTIAASVLAETATDDIPFSLLYLLDGRKAKLVGSSGLPSETLAGADSVDLSDADGSPWPLERVTQSGATELVANQHLVGLPGGVPSSHALVMPLAGGDAPIGVLIAGVSARRALDEEYRGFFELLAGQVAALVADARAYEKERRRAEALAELDRAKTAFFGNVSHEFRTPLTLLLGPLEEVLALPSDAPVAAARPALESAQRNSLRLLRLVNTLLDFSRIEAGRFQASFEPIDLPVYTAELAGAFRSAIEQAGLRLVVDCPPLPAGVETYVDRDMWEKIVLNLLSNAFKFTFEGEIAVHIHPSVDGGAVTLEVYDNGIGIHADELPHIFERFHRVRSTRARTYEGSGIGLALVRELVMLHGGTIGVESDVGSGTRVSVALPLGAAHLPAERIGVARTQPSTALGAAPYFEEAQSWLSEAESDSTAIPLPSEMSEAPIPSVLLADDNADMRAYVRRLLSPRYRVEAVADGAGALAAVHARLPDLVLADVMMPGMDGFALLQALRADPRTRTLPVILLSARAGQEATAAGLGAGADDYLVKPFAASELLARIQAHVALARLRREARDEVVVERDRLQQILDVLPVGVVIVDARGHAEALNRVGQEMVGYDQQGRPVTWSCDATSAGYGVHRPDGSLWPSEELPIMRSLHAGESVLGDHAILYQAGTGKDIPLLINSAPLLDTLGAIVGAVAVFQDITSLRQLERVREEFLSSAAHDLKTPLTSIRGHAQLAQRRLARFGADNGATVPQLGELAHIIEGTDAMLRLINELIDVTRLEMGAGLDLYRQPIDLVALLRDILAMHQAATAPPIQFEAAVPELVARIDAARITRVVDNLLSNATKYSPNGGTITVRVGVEEREAGPEAFISVADQGVGIPAGDLPHIFDRFVRAGNVVGHIQGTGIGLASAQGIVKAHGGGIEVKSVEGAGATFTVHLPLRTP